MLNDVLKEKNMSVYQCAKLSGIPYTTLLEVVRNKRKIERCSAETVFRLSKALNMTMEDLLHDSMETRLDFEVFKSNICHRIKDNDEIDFIVEELQSDEVNKFWRKKWYPEALYLLAMIDYLSRLNEIPLCTKYDKLRTQSLREPLYPRDVIMAAKLDPKLDIREKCYKEAIPEFIRFNIVESEIKNVV